MDIKRLKFSNSVLTAFQVLKLQVELHDGHSIRANRTVEELAELLEKALESSAEPVYMALTRLVSLMTDKEIVFFEILGVNFTPLRQWARSLQAERQKRGILSSSAMAAVTIKA